jgi:very-short-patch-repair endonuclease
VADGELHRMHRGVYLVGHEALAPLARESAAILACGAGAVISHASAASAWKLEPPQGPDVPVDVTIVGSKRRSREGLRIHQVNGLHRADIRSIDGVPVTAPARTLIDRAATISFEDLECAWADAHVLSLVGRREMEAALKRAGRRAGVAKVRELLSRDDGSGYERSKAERLMRKLMKAARLPIPAVNERLLGYTIDFLWRPERLVLEVDGYQYHSSRAKFESDRDRDAVLVVAGYTVIRITWWQLLHAPFTVVARVAQALQSAGGNRVAG